MAERDKDGANSENSATINSFEGAMPEIRSQAERHRDRQVPEPTSCPSASFQNACGVWDPIFQTRRDVNLAIEDTPYVDILSRLHGDEETTSEPEAAIDGIVREFMKSPYDSDACLPRADLLEAICSGASMPQLLDVTGPANQAPVALIDERTFINDDESISRPQSGPLTSHGLYLCLKERRFRTTTSVTISTPPELREPIVRASKAELTDAERRLIFITDLNRWSVYALVGTASKHQAPALRLALYHHVAFKPFLGVTFASEGLRMFQLSFSLPYFVFRTSTKPAEDPRRFVNGYALRQCRNVTFLDWEMGQGSESWFLYEGQISCMITGFDVWRWVGYCFVDTYFDVGQVARESVEEYDDDAHGECGLYMDPFTYGTQEAGKNFSHPGEYYLVVMNIRLAQVTREWENVIWKLETSVRLFNEACNYSLSLPNRFPTEEIKLFEKIRSSRDWIVKVRRLSRELLSQLSKVVDSCEEFFPRYGPYFYGLDCSSHVVSDIQSTFTELETARNTLHSLADQCDDFARDLELRLIIDNLDVSGKTHGISKMMKLQQLIMLLVVSPVGLSLQILALDTHFLPLLPPKVVSLIVLTFTFFAIILISRHVFQFVQAELYGWKPFFSLNWQDPRGRRQGFLQKLLRLRSHDVTQQSSRDYQSHLEADTYDRTD